MNELIKVTYDNDRPVVSARELHDFLEVETPFNKWFPRMCEYGFTEGQDFWTFLSESTGGRPAQEAALTGGKAKQNITHNLPVAIDLPLPVGEINVSTQKQLSGRPVTEVYFALYKDDMDQLEQSELWQQFCQAFAAVQSREKEK